MTRAVCLSSKPYTLTLLLPRYLGNDRSMLLPNCLFRVGGAAMLLTNKKREGFRAKYQLLHSVRTHLGARDDAYNCIFQV